MMLEMRVYIEKRHKSREIEQPGVWFTPPIYYDELEERIGVTDQSRIMLSVTMSCRSRLTKI